MISPLLAATAWRALARVADGHRADEDGSWPAGAGHGAVLVAMGSVDADEIQQRLRVALRAAMRARDAVAMSALRSVLAAIGNAEAISPAPSPGQAAGDQHFAGSAAGLGAAEAGRRVLTASDVADIVAAEVAERRVAAARYEASGSTGRAVRLRHEAEVIETVLADT